MITLEITYIFLKPKSIFYRSYLDLKKAIQRNEATDFEENKSKSYITLECKICFDQLRVTESPIWILDCGHLPFCDSCSQRILNEGNNSKCPICRIEITGRKRAYFCDKEQTKTPI